MKLETGSACIDGEYVGEIEMLKATIELEADNLTKFKVGDKVRVIKAMTNPAHFGYKNGDEFTVEDTFIEGVIVNGGNRSDLRLHHTEIELVKESDKMAKYKTEKRKARVGERILITDAKATAGRYKNGDEFTVESQCPVVPTLVYVREHRRPINVNEYEVIVGKAFKAGDRVRVSGHPFCLRANQENGTVEGFARACERGEYSVVLDNYDWSSLSFNAEEMTLLGASREDAKPEPDRIAALEAEVETLKAQVTALEKNNAPKPSATADAFFENLPYRKTKKTPNQLRADAIKQAREFVADLTKRAAGLLSNNDGNYTFNHRTTKLSFHVNAEKGVVTALAHYKYGGDLAGKAFAKLAPGDVFNADIGKAIAAGRLYGVKVPDVIMNAPQPTEWEVGMRITKGGPTGLGTVKRVENGKAYTDGSDRYWPAGLAKCTTARGIIDTEAQY